MIHTAFSYRLPVWLGFAGLLLALALDMACPTPATAAIATVRLTLDKYTGFAPLNIRVRMLVEPADTNRTLCVFVEGPLRETNSCFPHTPAESQERTVLYVELPPGDYTFWAVLQRSDATWHASSRVIAHILGRDMAN